MKLRKAEKALRELESLDENDPIVREEMFKFTRNAFEYLNPRGYKQIAVLAVLKLSGKATASELVKAIPFSTATIYKSIELLRETDKIRVEREGHKVFYCLTITGDRYFNASGKVINRLVSGTDALKRLNEGVKLRRKQRRETAKELLDSGEVPKDMEKKIYHKLKEY